LNRRKKGAGIAFLKN